MAQIQAEAGLVTVRQRPRPADRRARRGLPQPVGVCRTLDLDDVGAQIGEQPAQLAAGDDDTQVQDPDAVKRPVRRPPRPAVRVPIVVPTIRARRPRLPVQPHRYP